MANDSPYKFVYSTSPVNQFVCKLCGNYWVGCLGVVPPTHCKSCKGSMDETRTLTGLIEFCKRRAKTAHEKAAVFDEFAKVKMPVDPKSFWVGYAAALEDVLVTCEE